VRTKHPKPQGLTLFFSFTAHADQRTLNYRHRACWFSIVASDTTGSVFACRRLGVYVPRGGQAQPRKDLHPGRVDVAPIQQRALREPRQVPTDEHRVSIPQNGQPSWQDRRQRQKRCLVLDHDDPSRGKRFLRQHAERSRKISQPDWRVLRWFSQPAHPDDRHEAGKYITCRSRAAWPLSLLVPFLLSCPLRAGD